MKIKNFINKFIFQRKTLVRTLMELYCQNITLSGDVLIVGASSKSKLLGFNFNKNVNLIFTDIDISKEDIVYLDIEKRFELNDSSFDFILCLNVLEHIKLFDNFFSESKRVLKEGGKLLVFTPYFIPIHHHPKDYFRYSPDFYLEQNFSQICLDKIGFSNVLNTFYIFLYSSFRMIIANSLFMIFSPILYILEKINLFSSNNLEKNSTPLGIFVTYTK